MRPEVHQVLPLRTARAQFDRSYLQALLRTAGGNIPRAAKIAGIHPKSYERLMRRYGLPRP